MAEVGGAIVGGLTPFNYTEQVWVPRSNPEAVEERFRIMEDADAEDLAFLIFERFKSSLKEKTA